MDDAPITFHRQKTDLEDDSWLITFADMAVLLMCFFILLFSMSTPDMARMKSVAESLRAQGFYSEKAPTEDPFEKLKKELSLSLGASGYDRLVAVTDTPHGIEVELASSAFFVPGTAKFTEDALPILKMMSSQIMPLADKNITILVEGHTDDVPIATTQFPSNWELSAARAANVVRYIIAQGFPAQKLRATGLAGTHPKAPNRDGAGNPLPANQNQNRRVTIKLIRGEEEE